MKPRILNVVMREALFSVIEVNMISIDPCAWKYQMTNVCGNKMFAKILEILISNH